MVDGNHSNALENPRVKKNNAMTYRDIILHWHNIFTIKSHTWFYALLRVCRTVWFGFYAQ